MWWVKKERDKETEINRLGEGETDSKDNCKDSKDRTKEGDSGKETEKVREMHKQGIIIYIDREVERDN